MQEGKAAAAGNIAHKENRRLREDVEGSVEQGGARIRCLAFLDASIGSRFSARLQGIGCQEEAEAVEALVAFGQSCAKVGPLLFPTYPGLFGYAAASRNAKWQSLQKLVHAAENYRVPMYPWTCAEQLLGILEAGIGT